MGARSSNFTITVPRAGGGQNQWSLHSLWETSKSPMSSAKNVFTIAMNFNKQHKEKQQHRLREKVSSGFLNEKMIEEEIWYK